MFRNVRLTAATSGFLPRTAPSLSADRPNEARP